MQLTENECRTNPNAFRAQRLLWKPLITFPCLTIAPREVGFHSQCSDTNDSAVSPSHRTRPICEAQNCGLLCFVHRMTHEATKPDQICSGELFRLEDGTKVCSPKKDSPIGVPNFLRKVGWTQASSLHELLFPTRGQDARNPIQQQEGCRLKSARSPTSSPVQVPSLNWGGGRGVTELWQKMKVAHNGLKIILVNFCDGSVGPHLSCGSIRVTKPKFYHFSKMAQKSFW